MVSGYIAVELEFTSSQQKYPFRERGNSTTVDNIEIESNKQYALENATNNAISKYLGRYNRSSTDTNFEWHYVWKKIIYQGTRGKAVPVKFEIGTVRKAARSTREKRHMIERPTVKPKDKKRMYNKENKMEKKNDGKDRYRSKTPRKSTFKSVDTLRKEKRLNKNSRLKN